MDTKLSRVFRVKELIESLNQFSPDDIVILAYPKKGNEIQFSPAYMPVSEQAMWCPDYTSNGTTGSIWDAEEIVNEAEIDFKPNAVVITAMSLEYPQKHEPEI